MSTLRLCRPHPRPGSKSLQRNLLFKAALVLVKECPPVTVDLSVKGHLAYE